MGSNITLDAYLICVFTVTILIVIYGSYQLYLQWIKYLKNQEKVVELEKDAKDFVIEMDKVTSFNGNSN